MAFGQQTQLRNQTNILARHSQQSSASNNQTHLSGLHPNSPTTLCQNYIFITCRIAIGTSAGDAAFTTRSFKSAAARAKSSGQSLNAGHVAAGAIGAAAVTGLAVQHMNASQMQGQRNEQVRLSYGNGRGEDGNVLSSVPAEQQRTHTSSVVIARPDEHPIRCKWIGMHGILAGARGATGTAGLKNIPFTPGYASPRPIRQQRSQSPSFSKVPAGDLPTDRGWLCLP